MPGNYAKLVTVVTGQTITASERNNEFDNVITNMTPDGVDDASATLSAMQTVVDPSGGSQATDLRGELTRLRYQIKAGFGLTNWYDTFTAALLKSGGTMAGALNLGGYALTGMPSINGTFIGMGRNRAFNGAMRFDQNKEGGTYTMGAAAHYTLDQFRGEATGTPNYTVIQSATAPTTFLKSLKMTTNTSGAPGASDGCNMEHVIEGPYMEDFYYGAANAVTGTLSFWARASVTGTYTISFLNQAADYSYVSTYTISSANTWEYKTVTVPGPTGGTWVTGVGLFGLKIVWDIGSGSSVTTSTLNSWQSGSYWKATGSVSLVANAAATLYLTGVQWEIGSTATAFEYLPYGVELALLKRYVYKTFPQGTACAAVGGYRGAIGYIAQQPGLTTGGSAMISLPVEMNPQGIAAATFYSPIVPASALWYNSTQALVSGTAAITTMDSRTSLVVQNPQVAGDAGGDVLYIHLLLQSQVGGP